jgi:hypothetical protein
MLYHDEEPGERKLPGCEAEWPPEAFTKSCFLCTRPLRPGDEAKAGICTPCRKRREQPWPLTLEQLEEARAHYTDEAFLDASAEPEPACAGLWPASLQRLWFWHNDEFHAVRRALDRVKV